LSEQRIVTRRPGRADAGRANAADRAVRYPLSMLPARLSTITGVSKYSTFGSAP
jgi:hypothetical protein